MGFRNTNANITYTHAMVFDETLSRRASMLGFHSVSINKSRPILWQMSAALKVMEKVGNRFHNKDGSSKARTYIVTFKCDQRERMKK